MIECEIDLRTLEFSEILDLLFKWCVDDHVDATTSRYAARKMVRDVLRPKVDVTGVPLTAAGEQLSLETWGLDPDAIEAQRRAMAMFG